ncbi:MAG TPA: ROK family protein [Candidatus Acidoferrales bacterium]
MMKVGNVARYAIGVDIGGTKVAAGLVNEQGEILLQLRKPMPAKGTAAEGLGAVKSAIDAVFEAKPDARPDISRIGLCAPGPLDPIKGIIINPPNVPCWRNYPLAEEIRRAYELPVCLENDGKAAALAEVRWGAGRGYRIVFYATLGTGIGTGFILDGKIYHGRTGAAGEGGHVSIDYRGPRCACGKLGCIEALAAGPAIAERARQKLLAANSPESKLLNLARGDVRAVTSEMVDEAFVAGDPIARATLEETADLLTVWIGNTIDLLEPEIIVIGGGVAKMLAPFFDRIREKLPEWCINPTPLEIPIVHARYESDSGIAGAAALGG